MKMLNVTILFHAYHVCLARASQRRHRKLKIIPKMVSIHVCAKDVAAKYISKFITIVDKEKSRVYIKISSKYC